MRFTKQLTMAALLLAFTSWAKAGILFEPYLGYEATKSDMTIAATSVSAPSAITGTNYGLRLGYKLPVMFWVAADYSMGSGKLKFDATGTLTDSDVTRTVLGVTAGIDLPILLRFWAGTGISDQIESKSSTTKDTFKGTNTKVGLGFTGLPFVSLNLEYIMRKYTEGSGDAVTNAGSYSALFSKFENNTVMFSVSAPFNF